jgi:YVTN family beta-propeller protein/cysteine-rich repeat protein
VAYGSLLRFGMHATLLTLPALLSAVVSAAAAPPLLDEFQCYEVKPAAFDAVPITIQDRFGTLAYPVRFPHRLCAPAGTGDPGLNRHLTGYTLEVDAARISGQRVATRFGDVIVDLVRPDTLLVPTAIDRACPPLAQPSGSAMQCYRVDPSPESPRFEPVIGVEVVDSLETVVVDLLEPSRLCTPANVNGEDPSAPARTDDLLCYTTRSAFPFGDERVYLQNRFGPDEARLIHRRELCVPTLRAPPTTTTSSSTSSTSTTRTVPTSTSTTTSSTTLTTLATTTTTLATTTTTLATTTTTTTTLGSTTTTTAPAPCGDGKVDAGEECDDGNLTAGDCCSPTCRVDPDGTPCGDEDACNGDERCRAGHCETTPACRSSEVLAAITNFRGDTVSLVDPAAGRVQAIIANAGGPWGVAFHPRGTEVWITNREGKSITVIDVATRSLAASVPVGRTPLGIAFDPTGARAYVASYGGDRIDVIDTASRRQIARFAVDRGPSGIAFDPSSDTLWVTSYGADTVLAVDAATGDVRARLKVGRKPTQLAVDAVRGRLYVSSFGAGSVTAIDLARRAVLATIRAGRKPFGVAVDPGRARAYVTNAGQDMLTIIDTDTNTVVERRRVAAGPLGVGVDPAGRILVTSGTGGVLSFLDPAGPGTRALVVGALPVAFGSFVGTVAVHCPEAPSCDGPGPIVAGPGALAALLEAVAETLQLSAASTIPDVALAQAMTDAVARSREQAARGDEPALRRELRGILRLLRRGMARGGIERTVGAQLLDLVRRSRALAVRTSP